MTFIEKVLHRHPYTFTLPAAGRANAVACVPTMMAQDGNIIVIDGISAQLSSAGTVALLKATTTNVDGQIDAIGIVGEYSISCKDPELAHILVGDRVELANMTAGNNAKPSTVIKPGPHGFGAIRDDVTAPTSEADTSFDVLFEPCLLDLSDPSAEPYAELHFQAAPGKPPFLYVVAGAAGDVTIWYHIEAAMSLVRPF